MEADARAFMCPHFEIHSQFRDLVLMSLRSKHKPWNLIRVCNFVVTLVETFVLEFETFVLQFKTASARDSHLAHLTVALDTS